MNNINEIKKKISGLGSNKKRFSEIDITAEQQLEREKPKKYLELAIELFNAIGGKTIVEIGCMRSRLTHPLSEIHPYCCNEGHSTFFWGTTGANVFSADIDKNAVKIARKDCKRFKNVKIFRADAIKFLEKLKISIDLLYFDAWDVVPNSGYAENHLLAYLKAKPKLSKTNIISIDDTDIGEGGKGRLLIPVLEADNYEILVKGRQTIAVKGISG